MCFHTADEGKGYGQVTKEMLKELQFFEWKKLAGELIE